MIKVFTEIKEMDLQQDIRFVKRRASAKVSDRIVPNRFTPAIDASTNRIHTFAGMMVFP